MADTDSGPEPQVSIGDAKNGYPCPKDGVMLQLFDGGAWCPKCHTAWREADEVSLRDLDAL